MTLDRRQAIQIIPDLWRAFPHTFAQAASRGAWQPYPWLKYVSSQIAPALIKGGGRFLVTAPPQHGKSEFLSNWVPSWYLNLFPRRRVILGTYAQEYANRWGTKVRENLLENPVSAIPMRHDTQSKKYFMTAAGGQMIAAGVGGPITGQGADLFVIDDPYKNWQEALSKQIRESRMDWLRTVARTRLTANGSIIVMHCMTGDTPVLMADGAERPLRDIKPGDAIATYEDGQITTSMVRNWKCNGPDYVFTIRMTSGRTVKANKRHPFLVCRNGTLEWIRVRNLAVGDHLVSARPTAPGEESCAPWMDAENPHSAKDIAHPTTTRLDGPPDIVRPPLMQSPIGPRTSDTGMVSSQRTTNDCLNSRRVNAPSAGGHPGRELICPQAGNRDFASIIATGAGKSEDCSATSAISSSSMGTPNKSCASPSNTYEPILDQIAEIQACGREDVFDIQVDRTENFIANGLVSHNTRWHDEDMIGQLSKEAGWTVINLPAICENPETDPLGRALGQALCPERYDEAALAGIRRDVTDLFWFPLYQQNPTNAKGAIIQESWIKPWDVLPQMEEIALFADLTYEKDEENDFSVFEAWGRAAADIYLIAQIRAQMGLPEQIEAFTRIIELYPEAFHKEIEKKANGAAVIQLFEDKVPGLVANNPQTSKGARLAVVAPLYQSGNVYYPNPVSHPWVKQNIYEITRMTLAGSKANYDDTVDTASMAVKHLGQVHNALKRLEALTKQ